MSQCQLVQFVKNDGNTDDFVVELMMAACWQQDIAKGDKVVEDRDNLFFLSLSKNKE
jgi:hypothetical protein